MLLHIFRKLIQVIQVIETDEVSIGAEIYLLDEDLDNAPRGMNKLQKFSCTVVEAVMLPFCLVCCWKWIFF